MQALFCRISAEIVLIVEIATVSDFVWQTGVLSDSFARKNFVVQIRFSLAPDELIRCTIPEVIFSMSQGKPTHPVLGKLGHP